MHIESNVFNVEGRENASLVVVSVEILFYCDIWIMLAIYSCYIERKLLESLPSACCSMYMQVL